MVISVNPATEHISAKQKLFLLEDIHRMQRIYTNKILYNDNLLPLIATLSRGSMDDSDIKYIIVPAIDIAFLLHK